ncbi:hypothetical protein [Marmoricola sp. URHB0036]|uniref:hypothetical protein n=1 Tax=Marmoricola sp. URHB0036 TaxID=1298863 RepID=UPI00041D276A|nr:hypothetical protein [Marmoricola sp. URHB0036]
MRSIVDHASRRTAVVLATLLVVLLPSLLVTTPDALTTAVLAVACAVLVGMATGRPGLTPQTQVAMRAHDVTDDQLLPGRVTDPTHHPLRPRAPGTA